MSNVIHAEIANRNGLGPKPVKYKSPRGYDIIGTSEIIRACASIRSISDDGVPEYSGNTRVDWRSQETARKPGTDEILFQDSAGYCWTFEKLVRVED